MAYYKSFLNYPGGKYSIIKQLLYYFPKHCHRFVDLFSGSGVVSENYSGAKLYLANDINYDLINLQDKILHTNIHSFKKRVLSLIKQYHLTDTYKYSYKYYHANSSCGLAKINRKGYLKLRDAFNQHQITPRFIALYVLIIYGFNNQIRFNRHHKFNNPCGKRDWNRNMRKKLVSFKNNFSKKHVQLQSTDFQNIRPRATDFIYADPPYRITDAVYTGSDWTKKSDERLFRYLNQANQSGAKFALSNVMRHKGRTNQLLINWSKHYHLHHIRKSYRNSSYHTHGKSEEVLITNY